jgi:hypothetical protein
MCLIAAWTESCKKSFVGNKAARRILHDAASAARAETKRVFARAALSLQSLKIKRPADLLYDLITLSQLNSCVLYLRAAEITAANQRPNLIAPDLPSFLHNARTRHTL